MNFLRIVKFHASEIILDPRHAADTVAKACTRGRVPMCPTGCCDVGAGIVYIPLAEAPSAEAVTYYFVCFPDSSEDTVVAELNLRYRNRMTLIGSFRSGDDLWGLFRKGE